MVAGAEGQSGLCYFDRLVRAKRLRLGMDHVACLQWVGAVVHGGNSMILADFKDPVEQRLRARRTYPSGLSRPQDMDTIDKQMINEDKKIVTTERGAPQEGLGDK